MRFNVTHNALRATTLSGSGGFFTPTVKCQHFLLDKVRGCWGITCGMDNGGIFLAAGALGLGAAFVWGHWIGRKAGWCDGWDAGYEDGSGEWYSEDTGGLVDHYGESEN